MRDEWHEAMLDGAFEHAWTICDAVLRERRGRSCFDLPYHLRWVWDGTPLAGRSVVVHCYHGLGDTIQFIRFIPRVAAVARNVVVEAQQELLPLLRGVEGIAALHPLGAGGLPIAEVAIESMELPHALRLTLADLPGAMPYLRPPRPIPSSLRLLAGGRMRPRVGIVWAGGDWRRERSLHPELLLPLARLPIDLIGLQLGPARHDRAAGELVRAFAAALPDHATMAETAGVIGGLDLVVSVDTMVAHLAGALGRPVWCLLDADADWRWMRPHRGDTPWYPTMRLFRQAQPGVWEPVIEELVGAMGFSRAPSR